TTNPKGGEPNDHPADHPQGGPTHHTTARLHHRRSRRRTVHQPHQALRTPHHRPDRIRPHRTLPQDPRRRPPHLPPATPLLNPTTRRRSIMSGRKPNLRSSIYEGADGRWHGWVTMGVKDDGSPDRRHRTAATQAAVTRKVRELEKQRDAGNA